MKKTIIAPSKINAFLSVTGKRPEGYHTIETLFFILQTPHDIISIEPIVQGIEIATTSAIPTNENNLCWKAIEKFAEATQSAQNWKVTIEKNIPIAGGMAGGSTDAGAVLRLLNEANDDPLTHQQLKEIALSLGADVPLFIEAQHAFAVGVGEELTPIEDWPQGFQIPLILAISNFPVSAKWAYIHRQGDFSKTSKVEDFTNAIQGQDLAKIHQLMHNDLGKAVIEKFPLLQCIEKELIEAGCTQTLLSGSGPTLIGLPTSIEHATQICDSLNAKWEGTVQFISTVVAN